LILIDTTTQADARDHNIGPIISIKCQGCWAPERLRCQLAFGWPRRVALSCIVVWRAHPDRRPITRMHAHKIPCRIYISRTPAMPSQRTVPPTHAAANRPLYSTDDDPALPCPRPHELTYRDTSASFVLDTGGAAEAVFGWAVLPLAYELILLFGFASIAFLTSGSRSAIKPGSSA